MILEWKATNPGVWKAGAYKVRFIGEGRYEALRDDTTLRITPTRISAQMMCQADANDTEAK